MMDVRRSMLKSKGSEDMGTWETILDYTVSEELSVTNTYHEVMNVDATFFQKMQNAKKIIITMMFEAPSVKTLDNLGDIQISLYSQSGWYPFTFINGNYLPNLTSGFASQSSYYKEIDLTNISELGHNDMIGVYAPSVFGLKSSSFKKIDEFFGYGNMYNGPTILRVINKKVPVGKGSRIRVLVMP
jgi:hypothetical protein